MSVGSHMERYLPLIEGELGDLFVGKGDLFPYYGMMQYHMGWLDENLEPVQAPQGKRLRPVLCLLACEAVGGAIERALPAAAAIEVVHNFSLVHDDIEDGSSTRRHRSTVWKLWGQAQGINCGDGMYTMAYLKMHQLVERGVTSADALHAQRVLAETCLTLTEGQYLDMSLETQPQVDTDSYLRMICGKSAALIACAAYLGAYLGGADVEVAASYRQFGENLGMAFQVIDDILGIWGSETLTGKSTSTDILTRKKTLPVVYALDDAELRDIYAQETVDEKQVGRVVEILDRRGARVYAEGVAHEYSRRAMRYLEMVGVDTSAQRAIGELAQSLLTRSV